MNPPSGSWVWPAILGAVEVAGIIVLAAAACRFLRAATLRRAAWQAAFVGVAAVLVIESVGWRRSAPRSEPARPEQPAPAWKVGPGIGSDGTGSGSAGPLEDRTPVAGRGRAGTFGEGSVWLAAVWAAGVFLTAAWFVGGRLRLALLARRLPALPSGGPDSLPGLALADGLGSVRWVCWRGLRGPVAFGLVRPTVAVPSDFEARFRAEQRVSMLAHELGHLVGRDPWWFLLVDLLCAAGWWHPALWWARRRLQVESEWVADELAASVPGGGLALAESLAAVGRELVLAGGFGVGGGGFKSDLAIRVQRLLTAPPTRVVRPPGWMPWLGLGLTLGMACLPLGMPRSQAGSAPSPELRPEPGGKGTVAPVGSVTGTVTGAEKGTLTDLWSVPRPKGLPSLSYDSGKASWGIAWATYVPIRPRSAVPEGGTGRVASVEVASARAPVAASEVKAVSPSGPAAPEAAARETAPEPVPVVRLEVKWVEFTEAKGDTGWLDWLFGANLEEAESRTEAEEKGVRMERIQTTNQWRAIDPSQFEALLARLEAMHGVDLLSAPRITTLAGRQAQLSVGDVRSLAVGPRMVPGTNGGPGSVEYGTVDMQVGTEVDLLPRVESGRHRISVVGRYTEFVGYEPPAKGVTKTAGGVKAVPAQPRVLVRTAVAEVNCGAGETVVLRGPVGSRVVRWKDRVPVLGSIPLAGRLFRKEGTQTNQTRVYLFITPSVEPPR